MTDFWGELILKRVIPAVFAVFLSASAAIAAEKPTLQRIVMDGLFDDWSQVPVAFTDPAGDNGRSSADIRSIWLANDDKYIYLRFEVGRLLNLQHIAGPLRIYFDVDRSADTGFRVGPMGSDFMLMLPERHGAEQTADEFEAAPIGHGDLSLVWEPTVAGDQFELRIARDTVFEKRGTPIFANPSFDILFAGRGPHSDTEEWAPDEPGAYTYTLAKGKLAPWPVVTLDKDKAAYVRLVSYNMLWNGLIKRPEYFDRILRALRPDVICFQEVARSFRDAGRASSKGRAAGDAVHRRLDEILPLGDAGHWNIHQHGTNLIASRWALTMTNDAAPSTSEPRQAMALADLPDRDYPVDLYVISAHYKCCGKLGSSEDQRRQHQSDGNVSWFRELREPGGQATLPEGTPFVICGDLNLVGGPQILDTLVTGNIVNEAIFGPDSPPDWDGTPLTDALPLHNTGPASYTWRDDKARFAPGRLDVVVYTDSAMRVAKAFVLNTLEMSDTDLHRHGLQRQDTAQASDHLPLVVDFDLRQPTRCTRPAR